MKHTRFDISVLKKLREEKRERMEKKRMEYLRMIVPKLNEYFENLKVSEVYLVGSVLKPHRFHEFSDVDIALKGLEEDYFKVMKDVEEITGRNVDIIEMERCVFEDEIRKRGIRLK